MTDAKTRFKEVMRDHALEAGYDLDDVELAIRALDHGKQNEDDISEAYFRAAGFIGWTYVKDHKTTAPGSDLLRACRYLETDCVRSFAGVRGLSRVLSPLWDGVRAFGTRSP